MMFTIPDVVVYSRKQSNPMQIPDFINNFKAIHYFVKDIFANDREYTLNFVKDSDKRWYIDMPWGGNRANLEMATGLKTSCLISIQKTA